MPVAKPKMQETTEAPPRRDAGRGVDAANPDRAVSLAEAAKMLGITEANLAYLVDGEVIPHHMLGKHHRLNIGDVLAYKKVRERRDKVMDELVALNQEMGLYPKP